VLKVRYFVCVFMSPCPLPSWWLVPMAQRMFDPKPVFRPSRNGGGGEPL
jgi:hypothetical protein